MALVSKYRGRISRYRSLFFVRKSSFFLWFSNWFCAGCAADTVFCGDALRDLSHEDLRFSPGQVQCLRVAADGDSCEFAAGLDHLVAVCSCRRC